MEGFRELIENAHDELMQLEDALCRIPAPSWKEQKRAAYIKAFLEPLGDVHIDAADNVVFTGFDDGADGLVLFCAHTDTVFPDMEPFEPKMVGDRYYCPGAGDDTMNLAELLILLKYLVVSGARPKCPVVFAANSGEEGLGNLRGCRQLVETYGDRLKYLISLDGPYLSIADDAVGSHRYRVTAKTPGGHSFGKFGNRNAIEVLARMICELYDIKVPEKAKTTYNVGAIEGGTSVNTIAQNASMLYEYRSMDAECLQYMKDRFDAIVERAAAQSDVSIDVEVVGMRPCSAGVDKAALTELTEMVRGAIRQVMPDAELPGGASSTDCNIPLSMGIPAVAFGLHNGGGGHTREEFVYPDSLYEGMRIGVNLMSCFFSFD